MTTRFKYCADCGKYINSNIKVCMDCWDIKIYGSKEKARIAAVKNFKNFKIIGINIKS